VAPAAEPKAQKVQAEVEIAENRKKSRKKSEKPPTPPKSSGDVRPASRPFGVEAISPVALESAGIVPCPLFPPRPPPVQLFGDYSPAHPPPKNTASMRFFGGLPPF
jgi:hypothetical protein